MEVSPYGKRKFIYSVDCNHLTKVNISEIEREREKTLEITLEKKEKTKEELFDQLRPAGECPFKKIKCIFVVTHYCSNEKERGTERERGEVYMYLFVSAVVLLYEYRSLYLLLLLLL